MHVLLCMYLFMYERIQYVRILYVHLFIMYACRMSIRAPFIVIKLSQMCYLYYKCGYLYLCSAKAPLLPGSGSRRVYASTVFMCVCSMFRPSDFLLFVKNGFVVGVRCQGNREPPVDGATTPLSQRHAWLTLPKQ